MELRSLAALDAMLRPEHLLAIRHRDHFERPLAGMARGEGGMPRRVPVLRHHHMGEALRQRVDDRHDLVAAGNRQLAAGTEIVLDVDDDQSGPRIDHRYLLCPGAARGCRGADCHRSRHQTAPVDPESFRHGRLPRHRPGCLATPWSRCDAGPACVSPEETARGGLRHDAQLCESAEPPVSAARPKPRRARHAPHWRPAG